MCENESDCFGFDCITARRVTNSLAPSVWDELVPEEDEDEDEAASDAESKQSGADVEMASVTDTNGIADGDDDDFDATGMDEVRIYRHWPLMCKLK